MNVKHILQGRKIKIFLALVFILFLGYLTAKLFFTEIDPLNLILSFISHPLLLLVENLSNSVLHWSGSPLTIQNHFIAENGIPVGGFIIQIMYKKVTLFYIILLWLTRSSIHKKLIFTGFYLVLGLFSAVAYIVAKVFEISSDFQDSSILSTTYSIVFFCMNTMILVWYRVNKNYWNKSPSESLRFTSLLERKFPDFIKIMYVYVIFYFLLSYFGHSLWINFILRSSQSILEFLGYNSVVNGYTLLGASGSIFMSMGCLGSMTMFLFASMIYLTGNRQNRGLGFIILGLFILNLANIVRVVLLFIYIQKYGTYLALDVHDVFNYVTYLIVFILWVIWFEKRMGLKSILQQKVNP